LRSGLTIVILLASALVFPSAVYCQMANQLDLPHSGKPADQKVDRPGSLSGSWEARPPMGDARDEDGGWWNYSLRREELSMTPSGEAKFKANKPSFGPNKVENSNDPAYGCFPPGAPRVYASMGAEMQIIEQAGRTLMLFGQNVRQIYTDGRRHPKNLHPLWMGHSIGSWEGDVFVVDTIGVNDRTWLDRMGHPHSDALHLVERFRRVANDTLHLEMTVDDPKTYTAPWTAQKVFRLRPPAMRAGGGVCEDIFINRAFGIEPTLPPR
jgi:hypothetical protein